VTVTRPGERGGPEVCVTDDGMLSWTRDFRAEHEVPAGEAGLAGLVADPEGLASEVVATVVPLLAQCAAGCCPAA
jgi:hypothetical protein